MLPFNYMSISHYILESSLISYVELGNHVIYIYVVVIYIYVHHIIQPLLVFNSIKFVLNQWLRVISDRRPIFFSLLLDHPPRPRSS